MTYAVLTHSMWTGIHADKDHFLAIVRILAQVVLMRFGRVLERIVDGGHPTAAKRLFRQLAAQAVFDIDHFFGKTTSHKWRLDW